MSTSCNASCLIPPDPDIAGIGVRVAIYAQALLPLLSIPFIPHSSISKVPTSLVEKYCKRGNGSLVAFTSTSVALLAVAIIKFAQRTLTPYHALIVLNLTWIILISSCCRAAAMYYLQSNGIPGSFPHELSQRVQRCQDRSQSEKRRSLLRIMWDPSAPASSRKFTRHVLFLGVHLSATGLLGCALFYNIDRFAGPGVCACAHDTVLWMPSSFVRITDRSTRLFWATIYSLALFPPVTLPVIAFLVCLTFTVVFGLVYTLAGTVADRLRSCPAKIKNALGNDSPPYAPCLRAFYMLALAFLVLLIMSTEKTIAKNPVAKGEDAWGFGQMLAVTLTASAIWEWAVDSWTIRKLRRARKDSARGTSVSAPDLPGKEFEC